MGYVYKITNKINGKIYVGMSERNDESIRWKEHLSDYKYAAVHSKRPLYDAMIKYGVENFIYEIIECTDNPKERERYWIKQLNTYIGFENSNGYNATLGGDSRNNTFANTVETNELINLYQLGYSIKKISKILNHDEYTVSKKIKELNLPLKHVSTYKIVGINVITYDIVMYKNAIEASKILHISNNKIYDVIHKRYNSAGGYFWMKYDDYVNCDMNEIVQHIKSLRMCIHGKEKRRPKFKRLQKFVCVNTSTIFLCVKDAMKWCGEKSDSHIRECLKKQRKFAGKHPITKESLQWVFLDEYKNNFGNSGLIDYQDAVS